MLDGQGCLLPVRHFHHQDDPPLMLSSWSSLYLTCRAEAAVEPNPADTHKQSFTRSAVACSAASDAEAEAGKVDGYGELPLPLPDLLAAGKVDGYGELPLPLPDLQAVEAGSPEACDSHGELSSTPYFSANNGDRSTSPGRSVQAWSSLPTVDAETEPASRQEPESTKSVDRSTRLSRSAGAALSGGKVSEVENFPESAESAVASVMRDGATRLCVNEQIDVASKANGNLKRSSNTDEDSGKTRLAVASTNSSISEDEKILTVQTEFIARASASAEEESSSNQEHSIFFLADSQGLKRQKIENGTSDLHLRSMILLENGALPSKSCNSHNDGSSDQQQPFLPGLDDESALRCLAFVPLSDLGRLATVGRQYRDLVKSRTIFKLRRMYGIVEHLVFIYTSGAGGWQAYDANRNVWRTLPPANVNPAFDLSDRESLSAGTHVLWLGKEMFEFVYYRYDLLSNSWERGPSMVNPRCLFASASRGEFAFAAGGFGPADRNGDQISTLRLLNSAERYNSLTGEWEPLPPMSTPRHKCSGFIMDSKFYVIGGRDANHQPIMSGEEYNPATRTWRMIENMYFAPEVSRRDMFEPSPPLVAVVNNELYAVESTTNILKVYNKQTNTWRNLGYLPVQADLRNGWGVAFKSLGDRLFVMGDVEGILACCWRPGPNATEPVWQLLCQRERGTNSFLYNCAVMAC